MTGPTRSLLVGMLLTAALFAPRADAEIADNALPDQPAPPPLTLPAALNRAFAANPALAAARAASVAAAAEARQAGSFANPELSFEVENFAGSDALQGFDGAESTLRLDQTIELGGKRSQRRAIGNAAQSVTAQQQALTEAELYVTTVETFMGLLAAQQQVRLAETRLDLASQTCASIAAQIEAGKVSAIAGIRSQPLLVEARLERDRAAGALRRARHDLATTLGVDDASVLVVDGDLANLPPLPAATAPAAADPLPPQLALAAATAEQAAQELLAEQRRAIPDLTLGLGLRRFEENGEHALVAGLSLPLPLFDRNRSGIAAARARLEQARQLQHQATLSNSAALGAATEALANRRAEALALQEELLPAARQSFEAVDYGFRAGKFGLLDLLETQRQLGEVENRLLAAQVDCHVAAARLDALQGRFPQIEGGANHAGQ